MKKILSLISSVAITSSSMMGLLNINNTSFTNYAQNDTPIPPNMTNFSYTNFAATATLPEKNGTVTVFATTTTNMFVAQKYNYVSIRMSGMIKFGYWHTQSPRCMNFDLDKLFKSGATMTQSILNDYVVGYYNGKLSVVGSITGTNQYNLQIKVEIEKLTRYVIDGYSTLKINEINFYS